MTAPTTPPLFAGNAPEITAAEYRKRLGALLSNCGTPATCKGCGAAVYWLRHANGKNTPYTPAGLNHFVDCEERERFKRK